MRSTLFLALSLSAIPFTAVDAQAPATGKSWVAPRTPEGKPDLQGNWSNETQTPFERLKKGGLTLTDEQADALEKRAQLVEEFRDQPSDPNAPPLTKGAIAESPPGEQTFVEQIAVAAGGAVGGYNGFWLDPGNKVIRIDGVPRSSIIVDPPDGRIPAMTAAGKQRIAERMATEKKYGEFDGPELASLSDRCLTSFGSNAGPPMLPNYFYNNNYTIVQTKDHVMIMTEMVHDTRIIRLGATKHAPSQVSSWFGDSIGRWEGDTLVVETRNLHPTQLSQTSPLWPYRGASEQLKVTERFTRTGPDVINYKFTVEDPATFTAPYSGELPFNRINENLHEYACAEGNYLAARDRLTGVYNRGQFDLALEFEVGRAMRLGHQLSVAVLDLDRFKNINDTFGHAAGDRVLVEVAARLARSMRATDMIARYGGEEFAVLFPQTGRAAAAVRVETLRAQIAAFPMFTPEGEELTITCSAGIAELPLDGLDAGTLLARADRRLLAAKRAGRDRLYSDDEEESRRSGFSPTATTESG